MIKVMEGVRVLEVAQFTFVPAAGAILADWGADVIKVEHPVRGDTQRGFINMGGFELNPDRHPLIEHPNRGKRSVGIDVSTPGGQEVLYEIAKTADVFLTNYMPAQRQKNKFDVEHIRAVEPEHHLRPRQRLRRQGARARHGGLRRHRLLDAQRRGPRTDPRGTGRRLVPRHPGVRRLHRRDEHRGRNLRGPVPPRAHGRGSGTRRLVVEHGVVGGGRKRDAGHGDRRDDALVDAGFHWPDGEPVPGQLPDIGRRHDQPVHRQPDRLHPGRVRAPRTSGDGRRPSLLRRDAAHRERRGRSRTDR